MKVKTKQILTNFQTIALFRSSYKEDGKIINEFKLLEVSTPEVININETGGNESADPFFDDVLFKEFPFFNKVPLLSELALVIF